MYKQKKILGLIPARSGSKGLYKKNVRKMLGKPLIAWTIEKAAQSRYLDKVIVSTDCPVIAKTAIKYGAEVPFLRPKNLSSDTSNVVETILYHLKKLKEKEIKFDFVALLEPTSPLRRKNDIDRAIKKLVNSGKSADSLVSVGKISLEHPAYVKKITNKKTVTPFCKLSSKQNRQKLKSAYFPYGVIYISKTNSIKNNKQVYGGKVLPLILERWQNYEINDIYDFLAVEKILEYKESNNEK